MFWEKNISVRRQRLQVNATLSSETNYFPKGKLVNLNAQNILIFCDISIRRFFLLHVTLSFFFFSSIINDVQFLISCQLFFHFQEQEGEYVSLGQNETQRLCKFNTFVFLFVSLQSMIHQRLQLCASFMSYYQSNLFSLEYLLLILNLLGDYRGSDFYRYCNRMEYY